MDDDTMMLLIAAAGVAGYAYWRKHTSVGDPIPITQPPKGGGGGGGGGGGSPPTQGPTQPPGQNPPNPPTQNPGQPISTQPPPYLPGTCVLNLGWKTPSQADYGTPLGTQQIACSGPAGPNCTGTIARSDTLAALLPTAEACLYGQPPDGLDPDGSKLAAVIENAYGHSVVTMTGYDAIQTAPYFWYDPVMQEGTYLQNDLQHFNWKATQRSVNLSSWAKNW